MSNTKPVRVDALVTDATTTGAKTTFELSKNQGYVKTFTVLGSTGSGAGASVVIVEASLTGNTGEWETLGTVTLTLATAVSSGSFTTQESFKYVRGNVSSISGTGAKVSVNMGTQAKSDWL